MESRKVRGLLCSACGAAAAVAVLLLAASFLLPPAVALAQTITLVTHASDPDNSYWDSVLGAGSGGCSACHNLAPGGAEPGTSMIRKNVRTIAEIKSFSGGTAPAKLGCTFCHDRLIVTSKMKGVLDRFTGADGNRTSQHPVGRKFVGTSAYQDTNGEYLSSYRSNTAEEMDCLDCHDQALVAPWSLTEGISCADPGDPDDADNAGCYMQHQAPPLNNPYMLKNVTLAGQYDNLCRTCHGTAAASDWKSKGKDIRLVSHASGSTDGTNPLREADGTLLLTSDPGKDGTADALASQCTTCHSVHSSGNAKLFASAYGNGAACTTCHLLGDRFDNYTKHGHGKATATYQQVGQVIPLARPCTACHVTLDVTTPNLAGTRKPHAEKSPAGGSIQEIYQKKFNLNIAPLPGDAGADSGKPEWGICVGCHSLTGYKAHYSVDGVKNGCQDCHDEHAEGSGATSNIFMIPEKSIGGAATYTSGTPRPGTEDVIYAVPRFEADGVTPHIDGTTVLGDFYRADGKGSCDNTECHGASTSATTPGPLSTLMGTQGSPGPHSMGYRAVGSDCNDCHTHKDPAGGWRASASCDECHVSSDPAINTTETVRSHQSANESVATHGTHTGSNLVGDCDDCHLHNGKTVAPGTGAHMNGSVEFGGAMMPGSALNYATGFDGACLGAANGCHDAEAGEWKDGLGADACSDCHEAAGKPLGRTPTSGLHAVNAITRHDDSLQAGNCVNCHAADPSSAHLNGTLDSPAGATFFFHANVVSYDGAVGCRAAATCHGGGDGDSWRRRWLGAVDAVPGTVGNDTPGQAVCQNCHGDFSAWRWDEAGGTTTDHTDPYPGNGGDRMGEHAVCRTCHGWGEATYDRTWRTGAHGNGSVEMNGPDATHGSAAGSEYNDGTGGCMAACHGSQFALNPASGWAAAYGDYGRGDCSGCHQPGGSGPTVVWPSGNAAGRRTAYGSHLGATVAEESNAFLGGIGSEWNAQCNKCHDLHSGTIKVQTPPGNWADPSGRLTGTDMRARLGLAYANEPGVALHLGGTARGGASEAEFCWGCHDANGVSEWGFNTKTTPAGYPVVSFATQHDGTRESIDLGWIYTAADHATKTTDWTQGYWQDEYDPLISRRIASVHTASFDPAGQSSSVAANVDAGGVVNRTSPVLEARGFIRCSNCHDVHDTFGPDGKPYLRGRWTGNPYPPELPPRSGYAYTSGVNAGYPTPRGLSTARDKGGYFIDQNSNWPTANAAMDTLQETAELCTLCHATDVNGMDFYTGKKLWRAPMVNGHSNAALGGTGANKVDLFTGSRYGWGMGMQGAVPGPPYVCGPTGGECDSTYPLSWWFNGCCDGQPILATSGWYGTDYANWYGTGTIGGASGPGSQAHKFTCSKCHTPHASGLPALLPQNCIDPSLGNYTTNGYSGTNLIAGNCHRKTSASDGWHILAPGQ